LLSTPLLSLRENNFARKKVLLVLATFSNFRIRKILENRERGRDWLIAAIVHGSIGYYTPVGAENILNSYIGGEKENYSERCSTCFQCVMEKEIMHDISAFETLDESRQTKMVQTIRAVRKMDVVSQTTFGLFYPTSGL
jgi:hypothetical protein